MLSADAFYSHGVLVMGSLLLVAGPAWVLLIEAIMTRVRTELNLYLLTCCIIDTA